MTALEMTTETSAAFEHLDAAPQVRWEPCAAYADTDTPAPGCGACGWLADDHPSLTDDIAEADAIVVALPTRPALRRAS